jgi:flagellar biosynthesis protein FlhB
MEIFLWAFVAFFFGAVVKFERKTELESVDGLFKIIRQAMLIIVLMLVYVGISSAVVVAGSIVTGITGFIVAPVIRKVAMNNWINKVLRVFIYEDSWEPGFNGFDNSVIISLVLSFASVFLFNYRVSIPNTSGMNLIYIATCTLMFAVSIVFAMILFVVVRDSLNIAGRWACKIKHAQNISG